MSYRDSQRFRKVYGYFRPLPRATDTSIVAAQEYVDDVVAGIDWKQSVRVASTDNVSTAAPGTIDGVTLAEEDRVLLKNQTSAAENGIYIYYAATNTLTRTNDAQQDTLTSGAAVYVEEGTQNNGTAWILSTADPITVGTTNQTWVLFSTIYPVFVKSGSYARSTVNISFGNQYTNEIGSNVFFYVSGTIAANSDPKISVFGGDIFASGSLTVKQGLSGSLTRLVDGKSYLVAGDNITITSASNGQITIAGLAGDITSITAGNGLLGGASGGDVTISIDNSIVATVSGTTFSGVTKHSAGLSGSLTKLSDGTSYLIAGSGVNISSASNGAVTLSTTGAAAVAGNNTEIQFNSNGSFDSSANLNFNSSTNRLSLTGSFGMQGDIIPDSDTTHNLGSSEKRWANVFTGDLHLRNDRGDYTLIEEEEFLSIRFNKTGKRYKFLLERVPELDEK